MRDAIALTQQTFDRFDRAARLVEQSPAFGTANRSYSRRSPVVLLRIASGSVTSDGYPAYVQISYDNGATWGSYDSEYVRVKSPTDAVLDVATNHRAVPVGVNSSGEVCYVTLAEPQFENAYRCFALNSDYAITAGDTWEELTDFVNVGVGSHGGSASDIRLPSTGVWRGHIHITGQITSTTTTGGAASDIKLWTRIFGVYPVSYLLAPKGTYQGAMVAQAHYASNNWRGWGTATWSFLLQVDESGEKALEWKVGRESSAGVDSATVMAGTYNVGDADPFNDVASYTTIMFTKVSD